MSTTAQKTTREVIETAYTALSTGDAATFIGLLADDVELREPEHHSTPGHWKNKEELLAAFGAIGEGLGLRGVTLNELIIDGERAAALIDVLCTSKSGREFSVEACETWLVRDGQIKAIRPFYWDTAGLLEELAD